MEPYPAWDFAFNPVSLHVSGKIEGKAFRLPFQQDSFCPLPQAVAAQLILIIGFQEAVFFQGSYDGLGIGRTAGKPGKQVCWQLATDSSHFQQV